LCAEPRQANPATASVPNSVTQVPGITSTTPNTGVPANSKDSGGGVNWNMVGVGALNVLKGVGKIGTGLTIYGGSGAGAIVSGGTATPLAVVGFIAATGLIANGWVQTSIGVVEVISGFVVQKSNPTYNPIPGTLNQILAVPVDAGISSITGVPSTAAQNTAIVVDTVQDALGTNPVGKVGTAVDMFLSVPGRLN